MEIIKINDNVLRTVERLTEYMLNAQSKEDKQRVMTIIESFINPTYFQPTTSIKPFEGNAVEIKK